MRDLDETHVCMTQHLPEGAVGGVASAPAAMAALWGAVVNTGDGVCLRDSGGGDGRRRFARGSGDDGSSRDDGRMHCDVW